jgi:hypothetical protein
MLISGNKVVWIVKIGKSTLQEVELRANMYHLTMPPQYPDTGGANRLPPLKDSSGAGDNAGAG